MNWTRIFGALLVGFVSLGAPTWIALHAPQLADGGRKADVADVRLDEAREFAPSSAPAVAPARLADTGLYADFEQRTLAANVLEFSPQYPLWTDGALKRRWIALPAGAWIDASDADVWRFPRGTKLWKEFAFERRVETRYMELGGDGKWLFATYAWSADGGDATLAPERGLRNVLETTTSGAGGARYDIPSRGDCLACHDASANAVLGFSALQLSDDRDPLAPHAAEARGAVTLAALVERGLVRNLPAEHVDTAPRIAARSGRERAALGYLHANCGGCHDGASALASLGLDLHYSLAHGSDALRTTLDTPAHFRSSSTSTLRIAPGRPEESVLFQRLATRNPFVQMPALGTHAVDLQAVELLRDWIALDLDTRTGAAHVSRR
jgi:hypothetical protein